nr:protein EDS1-like [Ipomoea batatas]
MDGRRSVGERLELREDLIKKACSFAMKAHEKFPGKAYLYEKSQSSNYAIFAFPGLWAVGDWYTHKPFGETKVNTTLFRFLRSIGTDEVALVNAAFSSRFEELLRRTSLSSEVQKAVSDGKQIVFTGHSSGGPVAILAAIWCLETHFSRPPPPQRFPFCVTFGCPLTGDRIFSHALRREGWSRYFIHFVTRHDLVPRMMLAPISSIEQHLQTFFAFISPKSRDFKNESVAAFPDVSSNLFVNVMKNTCSVTSRAACILMGSTNLLLETVSNFIQLSPYRPFGTFIFCTESGQLILVENPDAILQILFFSSQITSEAEGPEVAKKSLREHLSYETVMQGLEARNVFDFNNLVKLPLSSDLSLDDEAAMLNAASHELGLSARARLCLRAAGEWAEQKWKNKKKVDDNMGSIKEALSKIVEYKTKCEVRKIGYYDSFKLQKTTDDFNANVKRLELAGIMDEVIEMLKRYELPDEFEADEKWVRLGTEFRRQAEPLDIANYYRHLKDEDTGPYMNRARPKRYRFTQRWLEHAERKGTGERSESCFWAEVEELKNVPVQNYSDVKERIGVLEEKAKEWFSKDLLGKDIFLEESTFAKWWKTLPLSHRQGSWISPHLTV